jgi:hydrogenase-4 component B
VACFVKVIGAVILGRPRHDLQRRLHEAPASMLAPMFVLAACCVGIGLAPMLASPMLQSAVGAWIGPASPIEAPVLATLAPFGWISAANIGLLALVLAILAMALGLARRAARAPIKTMRRAGTWDCGFAFPRKQPSAPRVQYTASSFAQMLVSSLSFVLKPREHRPHLRGLFPHGAGYKSHVDDVVLESWIMPVMRLLERWFMRLRVVQYGRVQMYVLYMLAVLLLLLLATFPIHRVLLRLLSV